METNISTLDTAKVDPETNFLILQKNNFTPELKLKFIEIFRSSPNFSVCAKSIGLRPAIARKHYMLDKVFQREVDEAREEAMDEIEDASFKNARNISKGFNDRQLLLKSYRGHVFNKTNKMTVLGNVNVSSDTFIKAAKVLEGEQIHEPAAGESNEGGVREVAQLPLHGSPVGEQPA